MAYWILLWEVMFLISYIECSSSKTLVYSAHDSLNKTLLPHLFTSCTTEVYYLDFAECASACVKDDKCMAMFHDEHNCGFYRAIESNVNSITSPDLVETIPGDQGHLRYFINFDYLDHIRVTMLSNCNEIQMLVPDALDGDYCLSIDGSDSQGRRIYCHGLDTSTPKPYLTLPAGPDDNYSFTTHNYKSAGYMKYEKLGLDLLSMKINAWDQTFAIKNMAVDNNNPGINPYPVYGKAWSCTGHAHGQARINLEGTGFYIPDSVQWVAAANNEGVNVMTRTEQVIRVECYGGCGGCVPSSDGSNAYGINDQAIEVRYDPELEIQACTPDWVVVFVP